MFQGADKLISYPYLQSVHNSKILAIKISKIAPEDQKINIPVEYQMTQ